jgi:hypothetical protein
LGAHKHSRSCLWAKDFAKMATSTAGSRINVKFRVILAHDQLPKFDAAAAMASRPRRDETTLMRGRHAVARDANCAVLARLNIEKGQHRAAFPAIMSALHAATTRPAVARSTRPAISARGVLLIGGTARHSPYSPASELTALGTRFCLTGAEICATPLRRIGPGRSASGWSRLQQTQGDC